VKITLARCARLLLEESQIVGVHVSADGETIEL
jgi:hypothetical protein